MYEFFFSAQFGLTLIIVIAFALWSRSRAKRMKAEHRPRQTSALARKEPDPQFKPDPEVTDPHRLSH